MNSEPLMFHSLPNRDGNSFLDVECDAIDPWVAAPLVQEPYEAQGVDTHLRRVQSTSAIPFSLSREGSSLQKWTSDGRETGPLPIRSSHLAHPEDISSLESSQSFLAGGGGNGSHARSFTEDSSMMHPYPGNNAAPLYPQDALAAVEFAFPRSAPAAPVRIPAQGGHWAWVPETNTPVPVNTGPLPLPNSLPTMTTPMVPVNTGALPLPAPMALPHYNGATSVPGVDLDIGFLDSFDILEMADTLAPNDIGMPDGGSSNPTTMAHRRAIGSCPLPTLLEDTLSAEDDGSNSSMRNAMPSSPSLERSGSGTVTTSGSRGSGGSGGVTGRNSFIPIPGARSMPLKVQRTSRSASQPHLPSVLGSSYPSTSDRPMRTAARRSMVVTSAALRETIEDSDSEEFSEDGVSMSGSLHARRNSAGGHHNQLHTSTRHHYRQSHSFSSASAKKKHNPWSLEETLALVEGVRLAGIGKWAEIKRLSVPAVADTLETRTPVDLKDKWRNLTRVARLPKASLRQRLQRGPSDVPLETMLIVKQLMEAGPDQE